MTSPASTRKVVLLGAGFLGKHIARALAQNPANRIQLTSRNPKQLHHILVSSSTASKPELDSFQPPITNPTSIVQKTADITDKSSLVSAFKDASVIVSLVGILNGTKEQFDVIQWKGVQNVISAVREVNVNANDGPVKKIIYVSAIGANRYSPIDYFRTKALAEKELLEAFGKRGPSVTIIRPSLVFGDGDGFFKRFATLSKFLPFLPVFGGGKSLFQPVFAGDIGRTIEILSRTNDESILSGARNLVVQAGGPDVLTYRQLMELILKTTGRSRPILSLPFAIGTLQGALLEQLPENILTVTRSQVEQLKLDSVVSEPSQIASLHGEKYTTLEAFIKQYGAEGQKELRSLNTVLPTYL
ncbi:hypothetical protein FS837_000140 [Tulasnella sp. UAMH 9824]|nr:hypothetical protein FS837_000140 [Tulasnella sp. UAMH 9824]